MKKVLVFFLLLCTGFSAIACSRAEKNQNSTLSFYYRRQEIAFQGENCVFSAEERRIPDGEASVDRIITEYLSGPESTELTTAFPLGTALLTTQIQGDTLQITLSDHCAELSGVDLTLSCAALAKTLFQYTDAAKISVNAEKGFSQQSGPVVLSFTDLLLFDEMESD